LTAPTFERIRGIASDLFGVPAAELSEASSPASVESWDSVQHLSLVLELEQSFGIHLEPEDMEAMKTLGAVVSLVDAKLSEATR